MKFNRVAQYIFFPALVLSLLLMSIARGNGAETGNLVIPKGTIFCVKLLDSLNSNLNKKGDQVRLEVAEDVTVNGVVVIPKGSRDMGTVGEVHRPGLFRAQGYIKITAGSFKTINNVDVPVQIGKAAQGAPSDTEKLLSALIPTVNTGTGSGSGSGTTSFDPATNTGSGSWSSSSSSFSFGLNPGCLIPGHEAHIDAGATLYVNTTQDVDLGIKADQVTGSGVAAAKGTAAEPPPTSNDASGAVKAADPPAAQAATPSPKPAFTLINILVCRGISDAGDPVGVNTAFTDDVKSLSIWCDFTNAESDTLLESKWYCEDQFIRTKQLFIDVDKAVSATSGTIYSSVPFQNGKWRVDILLNGQVLKNTEFVIR
ncbi:MAG: hypothetical protein V2A78_03300 [bacterium]